VIRAGESIVTRPKAVAQKKRWGTKKFESADAVMQFRLENSGTYARHMSQKKGEGQQFYPPRGRF
jgi:hypothetical protein